MKSHWDFVEPLPWSEASTSQGIVFIRDLNGARSVTNDAENVLAFINQLWPGRRLVYQDSEGEWAEIVWDPLVEGLARFRAWHGVVWDQLSRIES
jgi:hypothetical protein